MALVTTKKKKNTKLYIILALFLCGSIASLIISSFSQNSVYFLNVSELLAMERDSVPSHARIFGVVLPGYTRTKNTTELVFTVRDKLNPAKTLQIAYSGAVPDAFKTDAEVIVEGSFLHTNGVLSMRATTLMAKCPSKYVEKSKEMEAQAQKVNA